MPLDIQTSENWKFDVWHFLSKVQNCFELFVAKGDKIITLQPTFAMVDIYCKIFGAKKVGIQYDKRINLNNILKSPWFNC